MKKLKLIAESKEIELNDGQVHVYLHSLNSLTTQYWHQKIHQDLIKKLKEKRTLTDRQKAYLDDLKKFGIEGMQGNKIGSKNFKQDIDYNRQQSYTNRLSTKN